MTEHPTGYGPLRKVQQRRGGRSACAAVLAIVMLFFESPKQPSSQLLNTIVGHVVGIAAGVTC